MPQKSDGATDEQSTILQGLVEFSPKPEAVFRLVVVDGLDKDKAVRVDGSREVLVGKSHVCELALEDATVSRRHLAAEVVGDRLRIRDLGSSNATFLGDTRLIEALLLGGEILRLGATRILAERERGAKPGPVTTDVHFGPVLGASREMRRLFPLLAKLAASSVSVVLEGETGTGKEVVAQALHTEGPRASGPYVVFDCTAVTPSLIESELFGHERGAFTGAVALRKGVFEQAHGGTLFLDEIGDLPADLQAKLLRVLERGELRRVGGEQWMHVDVRVIAATRRDLDHLVQEGRFRDDLFHRLAVGRVELPPLRRRKGDVMLLTEHFCRELGGDVRAIPEALLAEWREHPWPGNVRELRNAVSRQIVLGELVQKAALPDDAADASRASPSFDLDAVLAEHLPFPEARLRVVEAFQRRYLEYMLLANGGNVPRAAQASGIALRYFQVLRARTK